MPGEFHGQKSLVDYRPWGSNESDRTDLLTLLLSTLRTIGPKKKKTSYNPSNLVNILKKGRKEGRQEGRKDASLYL